MNKKIIQSILFSVLSFGVVSAIVVSCTHQQPNTIEGLAPVYILPTAINNINILPPKPFEEPGKIIQYGLNYTLQVDIAKGVHVINCSDKMHPAKVLFIEIPGVTEIAIKDNILLANNYNDLVSISMDSNNNAHVLSRLKDVYKNNNDVLPSVANTYFECLDKTKGIVVGWKKVTLTNPRCKTL
jgi:hypothetical protein